MDDVAVRLLVVIVVTFGVGLMVARAVRGRPSRPVGSLDIGSLGLARGVVLFTSATCRSCADARAVADRVLGAGGYEERTWESDAEALATAGVDEVPLTVVVGRRGVVRAVLRGEPNPIRLWLERFRTYV